VDATNTDAVDKVYKAKQRPREKGLTTIVSSLSQAKEYAELSEKEEKLIEEFMPGPLTLVAEKKKNKLPENLNEKFVFRISSSQMARKLAAKEPITATSANISGEPTSYAVEDISDSLLEKIDYVLDAGQLEDGPTSTIVELENGKIKVHREGPIKKHQIKDVIE